MKYNPATNGVAEMNRSKCNDQRFWKKWRKSGGALALSFDERKHPELRPGEVFITNSDSIDFCHIGWKSKRTGSVILDQLGRPISDRGWPGGFPVFARIDELAAAGIVLERKQKAVPYFPPM